MFQIKYRSEIKFLSCFIWHFVNPVETGTGNGKGLGLVVVFLLGSQSFVFRYDT